jgi:hemerythrin-like domain-containing protein
MCSYCGCRDIPLIARLTAEHTHIIEAGAGLRTVAALGDIAAVAQAAASIGGLLKPHTKSEEIGLFAELRRDATFTAPIDALCEEHHLIDDELDALARGDLSRVMPLLGLLRRHIEKEELGVFPAALASLGDEQWERLHSHADSSSQHVPA